MVCFRHTSRLAGGCLQTLLTWQESAEVLLGPFLQGHWGLFGPHDLT